MRFGRLRKWNREVAAIVATVMSPTETVGACSCYDDEPGIKAVVWLDSPVGRRELQFRLADENWRKTYDGPPIDLPEVPD
jgi:hypothetical protein